MTAHDVAYWLLFTVTLAAILISWRRDVIRLRTQARIVPDAIATSRALATHDATANVTEVAGVGMGELIDANRVDVRDDGSWGWVR